MNPTIQLCERRHIHIYAREQSNAAETSFAIQKNMSTRKYNRIDTVSNKNIDCGFGNCDWQGTSYCRVGLGPSGPCCRYATVAEGSLFQPLEDVIHQKFIPALTGRDPCCKLESDLLALPCRLGGLNIPIPMGQH